MVQPMEVRLAFDRNAGWRFKSNGQSLGKKKPTCFYTSHFWCLKKSDLFQISLATKHWEVLSEHRVLSDGMRRLGWMVGVSHWNVEYWRMLTDVEWRNESKPMMFPDEWYGNRRMLQLFWCVRTWKDQGELTQGQTEKASDIYRPQISDLFHDCPTMCIIYIYIHRYRYTSLYSVSYKIHIL